MPLQREFQDWYRVSNVLVTDAEDVWGEQVSIGNAELVARLGSPVIYHQTGRIIAATDFSSGTNPFIAGASGTGGAVALSPLRAFRGGYSLLLTSGSSAPGYADLAFYTYNVFSGKIGLAIMICFASAFDNFRLAGEVQTGSKHITFGIRIVYSGWTMQYVDSLGVWQELTTLRDLTIIGNHWIGLKLVVDIDGQKYDRAYYGNTEIDMSTLTPESADETYAPKLYYNPQLWGRTGQNDTAYVDCPVITTNEP